MFKYLIFCTSIFLFFTQTIASDFQTETTESNKISVFLDAQIEYLSFKNTSLSTQKTKQRNVYEKNDTFPVAYHPILGFNYTVSPNILIGAECGVFFMSIADGSNSRQVNPITKEVYEVYKKILEVPIMLRLKYQTHMGFNGLIKLGVAFTHLSEKIHYREFERQPGGLEKQVKNIPNLETVKTSKFLPKIAIGLGFKLNEDVEIFSQYSYLHGTGNITSMHFIGLGIEFNLPI